MIKYFTDGSASPNPGPGGFAVVVGEDPVVLGTETDGADTTNIRMEGYAILAALKHADGKQCQIYTDSEFWIKVITEWAPSWKANGWKKKNGEIKNLDIVKDLLKAYSSAKAELVWVQAHADHDGNELADQWANKARQGVRLD